MKLLIVFNFIFFSMIQAHALQNQNGQDATGWPTYTNKDMTLFEFTKAYQDNLQIQEIEKKYGKSKSPRPPSEQLLNLLSRQLWKKAKTYAEFSINNLKATADFWCTRAKAYARGDRLGKDFYKKCDDAINDLSRLHQTPYVAKDINKPPQLPRLDYDNGKMTMPDGTIIDVRQDEKVVTQGGCQWSNSTVPRSIVSGPGCNTAATQICTGYLTCTENYTVKKTRHTVCSASNCGDNQAQACWDQKGYNIIKEIRTGTGAALNEAGRALGGSGNK